MTADSILCAVCDEPCHTGDSVVQAEDGSVFVVHRGCTER